jgi:transcriptional regulator with XRE-family HTH domain
MLDRFAVRFWIARRGESQRRLSAALGMGENYLAAVLRAKTPHLPIPQLAALANLLHVPVDAIDPQLGPAWKLIPWYSFHQMREYHGEIFVAQNVLTFTQGMDSYLLDHQCVDWTGGQWLKTENWDEHSKTLYSYVDGQRRAYEQSNVVHRIVAAARWANGAAQTNSEWTRKLKGTMEDVNRAEVTAIAFIPEWRLLRSQTCRSNPVLAGGWDKITIIDDRVAIVRFNRQLYGVTYHREIVREMRDALEHSVMPLLDYGFPLAAEITPHGMKSSGAECVRYLGSLRNPHSTIE